MHPTIKDFINHYKKLHNSHARYDFVKDVNTVFFVNELRKEKVKPNEVADFLKWICEQQIMRDEPLPSHGYIDMVEFAKDNRLFSKVENNKK